MAFLKRGESGDWMLGGWPLALIRSGPGHYYISWKAQVIWEWQS